MSAPEFPHLDPFPPAKPTQYIVITPVLSDLNGVLVDVEGHVLRVEQYSDEETLVRERLVPHADPTCAITVCHGWAQAPPELHERYLANRPTRGGTIRVLTEADEQMIRDESRRLGDL